MCVYVCVVARSVLLPEYTPVDLTPAGCLVSIGVPVPPAVVSAGLGSCGFGVCVGSCGCVVLKDNAAVLVVFVVLSAALGGGHGRHPDEACWLLGLASVGASVPQ